MTNRRVSIPLAALLLSACGGKVVVDEPASGSDCIAACAAQFPGSVHEFLTVGGQCLCDSCDEACTQSVCHDRQLPTAACLPCVQAGFLGVICQSAGFYQPCALDTSTECHALGTCIEACPSSG